MKLGVRVNTASALLCLAGSLSLLAIAHTAHSQNVTEANSGRPITFTVWNIDHSPQWPIAIGSIQINNQTVPLGQPMKVHGAWLSSLTIALQNISPKRVVFGAVNLVFPESGDGTLAKPWITAHAYIGRPPDSILYLPDGTRYRYPPGKKLPMQVSIPPRGVMTFRFDRDGATVQSQLAAAIGSVTKARIEIYALYFADGTRWIAESYQEPVSLTPPVHWKPVTRQQFLSDSNPME